MKLNKLLIIALFINLFIACKSTPKTPSEIYEQEMEEKTDEQLIGQIYGRPQNYKVIKAVTTQFHEDNPYAQRIQIGGVVQVIFTNGEVYLKEFGSLNGSYEGKYYANTDGSVSVKFTVAEGPVAGLPRTDGKRVHPLDRSKYLNLTYKYKETKGTTIYHLNTVYTLIRMSLNK